MTNIRLKNNDIDNINTINDNNEADYIVEFGEDDMIFGWYPEKYKDD